MEDAGAPVPDNSDRGAAIAAALGFAHDGSLADHVRQDYLDALPIAAAVMRLEEGGRAAISLANDNFRILAGWREDQEGRLADAIGFLQASGLAAAVAEFLAADDQVRQFEG